jgi:hypothetical protein
MKEGLPRRDAPRVLGETKGALRMLCVGLDLSRKRLDWQALTVAGERVGEGAVPPDRDGLAHLPQRLGDAGVVAVIESMSGARFVHDQLELYGWDVRIADAVKARGLAALACKTDRIDCWVFAELARRDLVSEIWMPNPAVRADVNARAPPAPSRPSPQRAQEPHPRRPLPARDPRSAAT